VNYQITHKRGKKNFDFESFAKKAADETISDYLDLEREDFFGVLHS
jgi:hypothetical protein